MISFENFKGKIIWSADVTWEELKKVIDSDFPKEDVAIKLDRLFLTKYGLQTIADVQSCGIPVFADAKIIEIPSKVNEIAKLHLEFQPWILNAMAGACSTGMALHRPNPRSLEQDELNNFAILCKDAGTRSCVVTVLTSKDKTWVQSEFGVSPIAAVKKYADLAIDCGITDIVCSGAEAKFVRELDDKVQILTPGIRLPESSSDDQAKGSVMTPARALFNGANMLVIGRDLSRGGNFRENLAKIMANIEGGIV